LPANFGRVQLNRVDPNFKRTYNIETTAGVQHELFPRVSLRSTACASPTMSRGL
jgi:hypothetical protein